MTTKTSNKDCRKLVKTRAPFQGSNLFAEWVGKAYVVYSYGYHFPIYAFVEGAWYSHKEKASVSTSRQQSQAMPYGEDINYLPDVSELKRWIASTNARAAA